MEARRKSVGPGTQVTPTSVPRKATNTRLSSTTKTVSQSPSHIPRYSSSTSYSLPLSVSSSPSSSPSLSPVMPDDDDLLDPYFLIHGPSRISIQSSLSPLHFLSLTPTNTPPTPPPPPSEDYDLELLNVVEDEIDDDLLEDSHCVNEQRISRCTSPHPDIMLALAQSGRVNYSGSHSLINKSTARIGASGGGGKIFAHWSRSHLPRSTTPPILERGLSEHAIRGQRICRSASSSPTHAPRSFIPRYVGCNSLGQRLQSTSSPCTPKQVSPSNSPMLLSTLSRTTSATQLLMTAARQNFPSSSQASISGRGGYQSWGRKGGRATSLPSTPRSISPIQTSAVLTFSSGSRILRTPTTTNRCQMSSRFYSEEPAEAKSSGRLETSIESSAKSKGNTLKSVRNLVKELESLANSNGNLSSGWNNQSGRRQEVQDNHSSCDNGN